MKTITSWIDGAWTQPHGSAREVLDKYAGTPLAVYHESTEADIERAIASARRAFEQNAIPLVERIAILRRTAALVQARSREFAQMICAESGSTIREATKEVERAVLTLESSAEEASRIEGDIVEMADLFVRRRGELERADGFPPHIDRFEAAGFDIAALLSQSA